MSDLVSTQVVGLVDDQLGWSKVEYTLANWLAG